MRVLSAASKFFLVVVLLAGCAGGNKAPKDPAVQPVDVLSSAAEYLDCLRETGQLAVSSHRGGDYPGLPENTLQTLQAVTTSVGMVPEIDVSTSSDGVLFLFHDDALEPKSTGRGQVQATAWRDIRAVRLFDQNGRETFFMPPTLQAVLQWSSGSSIFSLDLKDGVTPAALLTAVEAEGMTPYVILIAYTLERALEFQRLDDEIMVSLSVAGSDDWAQIAASGIDTDRLVAFVGLDVASVELVAALHGAGVEIILNALGQARSDDPLHLPGTTRSLAEIRALGAQLVATDYPVELGTILQQDDGRACRTASRGESMAL